MKIKVVDSTGTIRNKVLSNEGGYKSILSEFGVAFLKDVDNDEIQDFESLVNGDEYTLGSKQQQPNAPKRLRLSIFDFKDSTAPIDVPLPELVELTEVPPFIASESWMKGLCNKVLDNSNMPDTESPRVTPVALTRCSRGGKTRSLHELTQELRAVDGSYAIIFVSFNSETPVEGWENEDPVGALCRRIAFASLNREWFTSVNDDQEGKVPSSRRLMFELFRKKIDVSPESVIDWLGRAKCILIVDELNKVTMNATIATFLKKHFLLEAGRGLVFSSHVVSLNGLLAEFMDGQGSGREIRTYALPNIVTLSDTREKFKAGKLSPQEVLFLGMIPALIHTSLRATLPHTRRETVVSDWLVSGVEPETAKTFLSTILDGSIRNIPVQLLELVDIAADPETGTNFVRWIPFHMQYVLESMSQNSTFSGEFRSCTQGLAELFTSFKTAKKESGDAWEALFTIVLLIRCLCGKFNGRLLPLSGDFASVRYNTPYLGDNFFSKKLSEFLDGVPVSGGNSLPAISVYYPGHAKFETYDVIVAAWDAAGTRSLYGYQCKEGSSIPSVFANQSMFNGSYLIRGAPVKNDQSVRLWTTPSESQLDLFFGKSATQWSPKAWKRLNSQCT
jgi:hypothetical protein